MTKYEQLLSEYENCCNVEEHNMLIDGLYGDSNIWIKKDLTENEKLCILAEELGHHFTTYGDIIEQKTTSDIKQEKKARQWAYEKILTVDMIFEAVKQGNTNLYELSDFLGVSEGFLREALIYYKIIDY